MRFLGGLLKFLSILLLLAGTIGCTAIAVMVGIVDDQIEVLWLMVGLWVLVLFVSLSILGTGVALTQQVKLKKRMAALEQRALSAPAVPAAAPVEAPVAEEPAGIPAPAVEETPATSAKKSWKAWLPVGIGAALVIVAIIIVVVVTGGKDNGTVADEQVPDVMDSVMEELPPMDFAEPEPTEGPAKIEVVELPMGTSLSTGFMDMTFDEVVIQEDVQKSVTVDHVTRVTGPEPLPGQQYICLSGTIKNTSTAALPVYDFFLGRFTVGDYQYDVSANDCDVLTADGDPQSEIDPLMEYEYRIYVAVPEELAVLASAGEFPVSFTFGFYDGFDNQELSYNRSFAEDPIAECPYQYFIPFF